MRRSGLAVLCLLLGLSGTVSAGPRRKYLGPTVDPGVFVITHVDSCRGGEGYCILGYSCLIDRDFLFDDRGGHCNGLASAFVPGAKFVCCRENPDSIPEGVINSEDDAVVVGGSSTTTTTTTTSTTTTPATTTRLFQFIIPTEASTASVEARLNEDGEGDGALAEILRPGIVLDDPEGVSGQQFHQRVGVGVVVNSPNDLTVDDDSEAASNAVVSEETAEVKCKADVLLGIKCELTVRPDAEEEPHEPPEAEAASTEEGVITTMIDDLQPDREQDDNLWRSTSTTTTAAPETTTTTTATSKATTASTTSSTTTSTTSTTSTTASSTTTTATTTTTTTTATTTTTTTTTTTMIFTTSTSTTTSSPGTTTTTAASTTTTTTSTVSAASLKETTLATKPVSSAPTETVVEASTLSGSLDGSVKMEDLVPLGVTAQSVATQPTTTTTTTASTTTASTTTTTTTTTEMNTEEPASTIESREGEVTEEESVPKGPFQKTCGQLGGRGVFEAFGRAAEGLLPDLVASWVTGHATRTEASENLGGGTVTSTVLYCWMAAIMKMPPAEGAEEEKSEFLCTGSLIESDLVVTSAHCAIEMLQRGPDNFRVVLGDSNLNIDLPFGVQVLEIAAIHIHEGYKPFTEYHDHDIALLKTKVPSALSNTVCLLCLPSVAPSMDSSLENCTAISYGKKVRTPTEESTFQASVVADSVGILRKAPFPLRDFGDCVNDHEGLESSERESFICGGGALEEEKEPAPRLEKQPECYVAMDIGSPLVCNPGSEDDHLELFGLITYEHTCVEDKDKRKKDRQRLTKPAVFTNVFAHADWIRSKYEEA